MGKWIRVNSHADLPIGDWLVLLEKKMLESRIQVASVRPNITTIGNYFYFDAPRVIGYVALPSETEFAD